MIASAISLPDVRERARAAFLGLAIGDALGAPVEFLTRGEIQAAYGVLHELAGGGWLRLRPGQVTDDTEMSLCLARSIAARGGLDPGHAAAELAAWLRGGPIDVGNTVRRGLRRYMLDGSLSGPPAAGDGGNGAAMRMLPVALATLADGSRLGEAAVAQAHLTHHHPLSDAACVHLGELLQLACLARSRAQLRRSTDRWVARFPVFRFDPYPGLATGYVVDTVQTVLHFFFGTSSFEQCLVAVVNQGGDADTAGAIAGALAGAFYGAEGLPARWRRGLDARVAREIERLIDPVLAASPLWRGEEPHPLDDRS